MTLEEIANELRKIRDAGSVEATDDIVCGMIELCEGRDSKRLRSGIRDVERMVKRGEASVLRPIAREWTKLGDAFTSDALRKAMPILARLLKGEQEAGSDLYELDIELSGPK
jgi:hypothetical protein